MTTDSKTDAETEAMRAARATALHMVLMQYQGVHIDDRPSPDSLIRDAESYAAFIAFGTVPPAPEGEDA